ncbi:MAG: DNA gyrase subunit A [Gemmatimonadetes bacterium]|nr:MAG: DNA gyrase subunit A [Gemmatimonadota bacterium]
MAFEVRQKIIPVNIEEEMKNAYLDYSMSVIIGRALPDVRDGLKPVHRRVLYAMTELNLGYNKPYKKSARVVGETMGKYHPHGDAAIYDTLVRMAQDFSMRYTLVDGQGNFGSIDGDPPAAMRYTECRMARITDELMRDLDKETVNMVPNFDDSLQMPEVLPAAIPNLLMNGSSGIAVAMATNIPPHNLGELVDALVALIENPELTNEDLLTYVKGPDFPTGGIIFGKRGIIDAYTTGRGSIKVRGRANIESHSNNKTSIVISELPYTVNKARLIEKTADLVRDRKLEGISDIRDESDRDGMRIVIDVKRGTEPRILLNQLYKHTQLQQNFSALMLALVDNVPRILTLKEMLVHFLHHREEVIIRRTKYELAKAEARAHILEGLKIALDNLDAIIKLIRGAKDPKVAKEGLIEQFGLTDVQAQAILDMRLQRLTGLERQKIEDEYIEILKKIEYLKSILASRDKVYTIVKEELENIRKQFGDERRTEIVADTTELTIEDLIAEEDNVISITHQGYIKRLPVHNYRRQGRGGRGVTGMTTKDDDWVESVFVASTHSWLVVFSSTGRCYWLKVLDIPQGGRASKGRAIVNMINFSSGETIKAVLPIREFKEDLFVTMFTRKGLVNKTVLSAFSNPRVTGINAINLDEDDDLVSVSITDGSQDLIIGTRKGFAIRFSEKDVRPTGRGTRGVKGIDLRDGDEVVDGIVVKRGSTLLVVTENGYGKRTEISEYPVRHRGGKGVITIKTNKRNGHVIALREVMDEDELMLMTKNGVIIRVPINSISIIGRNTQGVRLISLDADDFLVDVARVATKDDENGVENNNEDVTAAQAIIEKV